MAILNHPPKKASRNMNGFVGDKPGQYSTVGNLTTSGSGIDSCYCYDKLTASAVVFR